MCAHIDTHTHIRRGVDTKYICVLSLHGKVLLVGGYRSIFCENMPEASPMCPHASQLQNGPTAVQGWAISDSGSAS